MLPRLLIDPNVDENGYPMDENIEIVKHEEQVVGDLDKSQQEHSQSAVQSEIQAAPNQCECSLFACFRVDTLLSR